MYRKSLVDLSIVGSIQEKKEAQTDPAEVPEHPRQRERRVAAQAGSQRPQGLDGWVLARVGERNRRWEGERERGRGERERVKERRG